MRRTRVRAAELPRRWRDDLEPPWTPGAVPPRRVLIAWANARLDLNADRFLFLFRRADRIMRRPDTTGRF